MAAVRPTSILVLIAACLLAAPAVAEDAELVGKAAAAFDDGSRAYREGNFELAASHFEAADAAVPSARALRMAMRARDEANQPDRAATLAELALWRYPKDEATRKLAKKIVADHRAELHRLDISCVAPCVLAVARSEVGARAVPGGAAKRWRIYLLPGDASIGASFVGGAGSEEQVISARAGGSNALSFLPKGGVALPEPAPPPDPRRSPDPRRDAPEPGPKPAAGGEAVDDDSSFIESPAVFVIGLVATAGLGGVLVWSGVDTLQSPGQDAVREGCAGQGSDCELYQQGLDKQLRTNILIGATAGMGVITAIIGIFVTDWGGGESETALVVDPTGAAFTFRTAF
jgi:hypothetical protein